MKKTTITVLSVILVFAVAIGAVAAVYLLQQAKIEVFNGRLGIPAAGEQPASDAELIVKVNGEEVGHEVSMAAYGEDDIPVLADVKAEVHRDHVWQDRSGNSALDGRTFVLTAKGGDLTNLAYDIDVTGNPSIVSALHFGFIVEYDDEDYGRISSLYETSTDGSVQLPASLCDGNITEGEEIRVSVAVWADAYALADLEQFDNMSFGVNIIFTAEPA